MVLTPIAGQRRTIIHEFSTFEEVAETIHAVIIQTIGIECCLAMFQYHIISRLCNLLVTIIVSIVAGKAQRVALHHAHMTESFERVGLLEEIGTVAIKIGANMTEMNMSRKDLGITILILVITQFVGMYQINTLVGSRSMIFCCTFTHRLHSTYQANTQQAKHKDGNSTEFHRIQP